MPREPDVFGQPTRPTLVERGVHDGRDLAHLRPLDAGHGIEIDAELVGMIEVVGPTGCGCSSRQARFAIHASAAGSRGTISSAVRPDGKLSVTASIHGGRPCGARFW